MFGRGMVTFTGVEGGINAATAKTTCRRSSCGAMLSKLLWMIGRRGARISQAVGVVGLQ